MSKFKTATIKETIPADKLKEIEGKHSWSFTYQGEKCTWGMKDGKFGFYAPEDAQPDITILIDGTAKLEKKLKVWTDWRCMNFCISCSR